MSIKYLLHNTKCSTHKYPCTPSKVQPKFLSFPGGASGKECTCQCRRQKRHRFDPWVESHMDGAWQAAVYGVAKSRTQLSDFTFTFHFHFSLSCIREGNCNPLQYCYLENPRDCGAWWAAIYGVAQSRKQLKRLSSSRRKLKKASFLL